MADPFPAFEQFHPFTRLARLLAGINPPAGVEPLILSIGEPQGTPPAFVADVLARNAADWGRYPPAHGTPDFRLAVHDWLKLRYRLPDDLLDPDRNILPVAGSREALYMLAPNAVARSAKVKPLVLLPNPFYHVYAGAIAAAGAEPHFLAANRANGFLPSVEEIDRDVLARTALAFVCSPSNPQGAIAPRAYLEAWIRLAREHDFTVVFDECYSEIWREAIPSGALEAVASMGVDLDHVVVVHSLSKRSGSPGLRSGFIAGDAALLARQMQLVNYGGVAVPLPILAASAALWRDETHVEANRARYDAIFVAANQSLAGRFGYGTPQGAFFAWLEVGDDEAAAKELWAKAGIKVLPGRYMGRDGADGRNPGAGFIRVALVHEPAVVADAMTRLVDVLDDSKAAQRSTVDAAVRRAAGIAP
ncbi:MAG: aminotransferase class I/II-fold pyridoxal phosphate-dependent enzyme [Rhodospirillaceae bacterium]|nr:aminotransferase class I/II-fold pyridoxal phosphate-dependent enzyme [Rhodospirillaceae bacterium]